MDICSPLANMILTEFFFSNILDVIFRNLCFCLHLIHSGLWNDNWHDRRKRLHSVHTNVIFIFLFKD